MIAIPDFAAGAMENYGLITYRETALLYDDKHSAAVNKQRVIYMLEVGWLPMTCGTKLIDSILDVSNKTLVFFRLRL